MGPAIMRVKRRVALLVETSRSYGRGIVGGVSQFLREHDHWSVDFTPIGIKDTPTWLTNWRGDGVLSRVEGLGTAEAIVQMGVPCIDLRGTFYDLGGLPFGSDNKLVASAAFEHLQSCGLQYFGYYGPPPGESRCDDRRCSHFCQLVEEAGYDCDLFSYETDQFDAKQQIEHSLRLSSWVRELQKPVGIMACRDEYGREILDACRRENIHVPEEVAVIGVDNDPSICQLCDPSLTSVDLNPERIGYEASVALDRLMEDSQSTQKEKHFPPRGVVTRQSTDMIAVDDHHVATALGLIRLQACHGICVSDVLEHISLSQRALQRRFKELLGRTIKAEIIRVRIEKAKELLIETELPVKTIAMRSGFRRSKHLIETFHRTVGMTPLTFRDQVVKKRP